MTKNLGYLILTIIILKLCSCNDPSIAEIKNSKDKDKIDSLYSLVTFNFLNDSIIIIAGGQNKNKLETSIPSKWSKSFAPMNNGYKEDIIITYMQTEKGLFKLVPLKSLPLIIKNSKLDYNNQIFLELDTKNLIPGLYEDYIYFNDAKNLGFKISVNVKF